MSGLESWRAVPGFESSYEVSDLGRVRSLDRYVRCGGRGDYTDRTRLLKGRILSPMTNRKRGGYRYVNMQVDGRQTLRRVCVLVAAAFLGPRPPGKETRHLNGNAQDDRAVNLQYGTAKQNAADRVLHGTHLSGEKCPNARLTERDVRHILTCRSSADALSIKYGVHPGHINNIRRRVRWVNVRV